MKHSTARILYEGKHKYKIADVKGQYRLYAETASAGVWMSCSDLLTLGIDLMNGYNNANSKINSRFNRRYISRESIEHSSSFIIILFNR